MVTPRSVGTTIGYMIKRWDKFIKYTDHGHVEIDNNIIENMIGPLALGHKTISLPDIMMPPSILDINYTIFGTCKALGVNPYDYIVKKHLKVPSLKTLDT
ncbi:MAG: transposase [Saprospiraceae bacterium]|nr:transposase [Saprospiraceae bacterium]